MSDLFWRVSKRLDRVLRRSRVGAEMAALSESGVLGASLADAFRSVMEGRFSDEERAVIERIENLRSELSASTEEIPDVHFGAGAVRLEGTIRISDECRISSMPAFWMRVLFRLLRAFQPEMCLELGTNLGLSGAYQATALSLNERGKLVTVEGSPPLASRARQHFASLGLDNVEVVTGRFQDVLDDVIAAHAPFDYAFIDGHHDERATVAYFEAVVLHCSANALLVFDDISWSRGMERAWRRISADEAVAVSVDLLAVGVCLLGGDATQKQHFTLAIE